MGADDTRLTPGAEGDERPGSRELPAVADEARAREPQDAARAARPVEPLDDFDGDPVADARAREEPEETEGAGPDHGREHRAGGERRERARPYAQILAWGLATRVLVFATAALVVALDRPEGILRPPLAGRPFSLLTSWDGRWYQIVADRGYLLVPGRQSDPAFFPLLPICLSVLHELGLSLAWAGLVLSNLVFLAGLLVFYELGRLLLPEADARRAACYVALFPVGFVFSMIYPEALAFTALALACLLAVRGRWLLSALAVAAATLARPEGVFVALPIALLAARAWPALRFSERSRAVAAVLAGPAALASYPLYLWWSIGDPRAWQQAERDWGRAFRLDGWAHALRNLSLHPQFNNLALVGAVFCALYLVALALAWRAGIPAAWIVFGALLVVVPPFSGSFAADARFGLLALPAYWGLARVGRSRVADYAIRLVGPPLLAAGVVSLVFWFP
jgi:hypothetical protein